MSDLIRGRRSAGLPLTATSTAADMVSVLSDLVTSSKSSIRHQSRAATGGAFDDAIPNGSFPADSSTGVGSISNFPAGFAVRSALALIQRHLPWQMPVLVLFLLLLPFVVLPPYFPNLLPYDLALYQTGPTTTDKSARLTARIVLV